jgi:hypothetical protein
MILMIPFPVLPENLKAQGNPTFMIVGLPFDHFVPHCSQCICHHFDSSKDGEMGHELSIPLHDTEAQFLGTLTPPKLDHLGIKEPRLLPKNRFHEKLDVSKAMGNRAEDGSNGLLALVLSMR